MQEKLIIMSEIKSKEKLIIALNTLRKPKSSTNKKTILFFFKKAFLTISNAMLTHMLCNYCR